MKIKKGVEEARNKDFALREDVQWYHNRLCVPNAVNLRKELLKEAHNSTLTTHPGSTKMYHDPKIHFWWIGKKRDSADYVTRCQLVKRLRPTLKGMEAYCNPYLSQYGNGSMS